MDFNRYADVMDELVDLVAGDSRLAAFLPQVTQLRDQARAVALGGKEMIPPLPRPPKRAIPDRTAAQLLLRKINEIPFCDPAKESADVVRLFGGLSRNLVIAVMHEIIQDFPDLVSTPAEEEPEGRHR